MVRNPFNKRMIAPAGEEVTENTYWLRLQKQGDITISDVKDDVKDKKGGKQ